MYSTTLNASVSFDSPLPSTPAVAVHDYATVLLQPHSRLQHINAAPNTAGIPACGALLQWC